MQPWLEQDVFAKRRARVAAALQEGQTLVVATQEETTYSHDVHHRFRPHSDFWYLTGFAEPEAVMTLDHTGRYGMWMRPRDPTSEVWNGRRLGLERAEELGVDHVHDIREMEALTAYLKGGDIVARTAHHRTIHEAVDNAGDVEDAGHLLAGFRMIKDDDEIAMLQKAADLGADAMRAAAPLVAPGRGEFEVEAALVSHYRAAGSTGPGYPPIVGAGDNAAILHYIENTDRIAAGDLVLIDAGCEWGYYNSDITRTFPAGEVSDLQRDIYEAVERAQRAALDKVRPGNQLKDPHEAAVASLVESLVDMGHLEGDKDKLIAGDAHRPFYMHGTSHYLGLDVHDAGHYKEDGESIKLRPGMCITIEPGLYYNAHFAKCPPGTEGIGVRLENDIVLTDDGHLDLLAGLPTAWDDITELQEGFSSPGAKP